MNNNTNKIVKESSKEVKEKLSQKMNKIIKKKFCKHLNTSITILTMHEYKHTHYTYICKNCGKAIKVNY